MPAEVGSGSFWTGMIEYVQSGPDSLEGVLADIEDSWPHAATRERPSRGGRSLMQERRHRGG